MGRREDLAAADAKRRAKVRRRRQWAAGNRRGLRRDGSVGGREDMARGGSGPLALAGEDDVMLPAWKADRMW